MKHDGLGLQVAFLVATGAAAEPPEAGIANLFRHVEPGLVGKHQRPMRQGAGRDRVLAAVDRPHAVVLSGNQQAQRGTNPLVEHASLGAVGRIELCQSQRSHQIAGRGNALRADGRIGRVIAGWCGRRVGQRAKTHRSTARAYPAGSAEYWG